MTHEEILFRQAFQQHRPTRPPLRRRYAPEAGAGANLDWDGRNKATFSFSESEGSDASIHVCRGIPTGDVVVEITREQFAAYVNGGVWTITEIGSQIESWDDPGFGFGTANGTWSGSSATRRAGCKHSAELVTPTHVDYEVGLYGGPPSYFYSIPINPAVTLEVHFGSEGGKSYMGITLNTSFASSAGDGTGYSVTTAKVDGIDIPMVSTWTPGASTWAGYTNSSVFVVTATFTPA